jgi:hypothetical protein
VISKPGLFPDKLSLLLFQRLGASPPVRQATEITAQLALFRF